MKYYFVWHPIAKDLIEEFKKKENINILASYYFLIEKKSPLNYKFLLDSGAYSAFNAGKEINIDNYIKFIKDNKDIIENYFGLDEIGNAEKTLENQKYMESKGLKPIPTFHADEDFNYLKEYCKNYDYIALGGVAQLKDRRKVIRWLQRCFSFIPEGIKVHGFAITSPYIISKFPFYSVDSSSWSGAGRWGTLSLFTKGKFTKIKKRFKSTTESNKLIHRWNIVQYIKFAKHLEEKNGIQKIKNR